MDLPRHSQRLNDIYFDTLLKYLIQVFRFFLCSSCESNGVYFFSLRGTHPLRNFAQVTFSNLGLCLKVTGLHCSTKITYVQISMLCIGAD